MKNFFLTAFLASLLFTSCSSDDDSTGNILEKTVTTDREGNTSTTYYENGLVTRVGNSDLYHYDSSGKLISKTVLISGNEPLKYRYTYNEHNHLTQIETTGPGTNNRIVTYVYDYTNNTITEGDEYWWDTYYFNEENKIYMHKQYRNYVDTQVYNDYEITYEGTLPVKYTNTQRSRIWGGPLSTPTVMETIFYTYDNEHDKSLLGIKEDACEINATLISGYYFSGNTSKYLIKKESEDGVSNFYYEFNDKGLPEKRITEYNGEIVSETKFYYH